jgi:hypothetical protein
MASCIDLTGDEDAEMATYSTDACIVIDLTQDSDAPPPRQLRLPTFDTLIRSNALLDTPQPQRLPSRSLTGLSKNQSLGDNCRDSLFGFEPNVVIHEPEDGPGVTIGHCSVSKHLLTLACR